MSISKQTIHDWLLSKLEPMRESPCVLLRDPLHLLPEANGGIHGFASSNGFTVVVASTNLVFRELYEKASADSEIKKLLIVDRAPARRRSKPSLTKAPPPFYPDLLNRTPLEARLDLDLRQFLKEITGDPNWPHETNDPQYARLIVRNLDDVLRAHRNLRIADTTRFTDHDFKTIVAFAALGVAESAFKTLDAEDYWKIGLLGHKALEDLESLTPEITRPLRDKLSTAPAPFCWLAEHDSETVVRAFYLSAILAQHLDHWNLLLANIDPALAPLSGIETKILKEAAPKLVRLDPEQAVRDIEAVENSLGRDALQLLLLSQLKLTNPPQFVEAIEKEKYSMLIRSLALLLALDDLLSNEPALPEQERIGNALFGETSEQQSNFIVRQTSPTWLHLREAYGLAGRIRSLRSELAAAIKTFNVIKPDYLNYRQFLEVWNKKDVNRLEYLISALERLVHSGEFLPRPEDELPSIFGNALDSIRKRVRALSEEIGKDLDDLNLRFQSVVFRHYPSWVQKESDVLLTSQFLRRCLKPHWDPQTEKAVIFIFDGMRYDIWDEFIRPLFEERMELIKEYPACSLLPSETHITRKAISAGTFPDEFDAKAGEDKLLKAGLAREFGYQGEVDVISPETLGTGETVRYRAGNLDMYIFELCDKELHKIQVKTLPDGRQVPSRPLAFIYQQHLKNIIDTEVMAIVRSLAAGTKVFVTADHGFGYVHRERVWLEAGWLNHPLDCSYRNAWLRQSLDKIKAPAKVRERVWEFPVAELRMPATENTFDSKTKTAWTKQFAAVIFPKTGYALSRPGAHFNPDAYSHGGISIQELTIPMSVLRVREKDEGLLRLDEISGPTELIEGQDAEYRLHLSWTPKAGSPEAELLVEAAGTYTRDPDRNLLGSQILYVSAQGAEVIYRFKGDSADATDEERRNGAMERILTITVAYRHGQRTFRVARTHRFTVRLNSERVMRRVPVHLGSILGLTPKSMR